MMNALDSPISNAETEDSLAVKRLLWVDDDPNLAAGFSRRLRRHGIQVLHAYDGMQGYWMAASQQPDVVITDLKMQNWPGQELVECLSLNNRLSGIPTIVVSGHATPADKKKLLALGVVAVLEKPVNLEDLLVVLDKLAPPKK